jgi:hypothetical protein
MPTSSVDRLAINPVPHQHDSHRYYLAHAFAAGETFLTAINMLDNSSERTSAKARTEEAIAYVMKLLEEYDANTPRGTY